METIHKDNSKVYNSCEEEKDETDGLVEEAVLLHNHFDNITKSTSKPLRQSLLQFFGVVLILIAITVASSLIEYFFIRITGEKMNATVNYVEVFFQNFVNNESMIFETSPHHYN